MKYLGKIVNLGGLGLNIRSGAGTQHNIIGRLVEGDTIIIIDRKPVGNEVWDQLDSGGWVCNTFSTGAVYVQTVKDLEGESKAQIIEDPNMMEEEKENPSDYVTVSDVIKKSAEAAMNGLMNAFKKKKEENQIKDSLPVTYNVPDDTQSEAEVDYNKLFITVNAFNYPKPLYKNSSGETVYDYRTNTDLYKDNVRKAKRELNIWSAFSKNEIQRNMYNNFSRFKQVYPDMELTKMIPYVIFTRPDLNLVDDQGQLIEQAKNHPRIYGNYQTNRDIVRSLCLNFTGSHDFNPILSNRVLSLEVSDESLDTLETGETFSGYKTIYAKHNIKSITAGNISMRFREVADMGITRQIQTWVDYETGVYRGVLLPKTEYIFEKILDYACDAYLFLLDQQFEKILFWTKYYGIFPLNVNKSVFSYDAGSKIELPEVNVTFAYIYKEDLNPLAMTEFNSNSSGEYKYSPNFIVELGSSGLDWCGAPYIESYHIATGINGGEEGFNLRFRKSI